MTTPTPGNGPAGGPALPKLGPGQLRARVAGVLASAPNRAWTVTAITAVLKGRSAGAVGAACDRLVELGRARQPAGSPRRYQAPAAHTGPGTAPTSR
jgi:nitric oxide reductase NorQ protein